MSLDVYLTMEGVKSEGGSGIFVRENGANKEITREEWDAAFPGREPIIAKWDGDNEVYSANITHNLNKMAAEVKLGRNRRELAEGKTLHDYLWYPDENGIQTAAQLIDPLKRGLALLEALPGFFKQFNPSNGWGDYDGLVSFVAKYLQACERYPAATVGVSR